MTCGSDDTGDWTLAVAGDGEAFGRIFDRHHDRIIRHSYRLVPNAADVDDVLAVTFLEAWRGRERVRIVDGSLLPWLLVTATNTARNLKRGTRRYQALLRRIPPPDPVWDHAVDFEDGPATRALRDMAITDQQVIVLCLLEGFTTREAANALGLPEGTIKSRLSRARHRLLQQLPPHIRPTPIASGESL